MDLAQISITTTKSQLLQRIPPTLPLHSSPSFRQHSPKETQLLHKKQNKAAQSLVFAKISASTTKGKSTKKALKDWIKKPAPTPTTQRVDAVMAQ